MHCSSKSTSARQRHEKTTSQSSTFRAVSALLTLGRSPTQNPVNLTCAPLISSNSGLVFGTSQWSASDTQKQVTIPTHVWGFYRQGAASSRSIELKCQDAFTFFGLPICGLSRVQCRASQYFCLPSDIDCCCCILRSRPVQLQQLQHENCALFDELVSS